MESPVRVTSTDEDEFVDIEGDIDDITKDSVVTIEGTKKSVYDMNKGLPNNSKNLNQSVPFKRQKTCKTPKDSESFTENDFTKWWKSASDFQQPVTPIGESVYDATTEPEGTESINKLDPILQNPTKRDRRESSCSESDSTFCDESGEIFHPPSEETFLMNNEISEQEREKFPEFFSGRTKYSPHNYVTIRNTILKLWQDKQPEHVNKVMLRPILKKSCGNVNNVGRIHRFLESIGAINFGSDSVWWKRKRRKIHIYRPPKTALDTDFKLKRALEQRMSGRNRKKPAVLTSDLCSNDSVGGYTIDHVNNNTLIIPKMKKEFVSKSSTSKKYNLVRCREYGPIAECPYEVTIQSSALVIMDLHSHLSTHEVMGLIGGYATKYNNGKVKVCVTCAQPCKSSGSTRQCEMDAVSQSVACEEIMQKGLKVIGWYHSHPTFPPHPSETDIATQLEQQSIFSSHGSVFLGMILTPYYKHQIKTDLNLVHVERTRNDGTTGNIPFSVSFEIDAQPLEGGSELELMSTFSDIVEKSVADAGKGNTSSRLSHLLDPIVQGSTVTHLDKLMKSLSAFVTSLHDSSVTSDSDTTPVPDMDASQPDIATFDSTFNGEAPILASQDIMTSAYEIVTSQDIMTSAYEIVTSQPQSEDIVGCILAGDSYSINQNFPSLIDDGFCQETDLLLHGDVTIAGDVIDNDVILELPACDGSRTLHPSWSELFDKLKFLLLSASEKVLNI